MTLMCKYYTELVEELHWLDVPFDDSNMSRAWKDFRFLPKTEQGGMKKTMSYMKLLIRQESSETLLSSTSTDQAAAQGI